MHDCPVDNQPIFPDRIEPEDHCYTQTAVIAIIAIGQTFVIITGGIDLSVGANLALSNILAASMMTSGVPLWICIITSLAFKSIAF